MSSLLRLFGFIGLTLAMPALAAVTATDMQVAARALSFIERPLNGVVRVAILHAPGSPRSLEQARSLQTLLGEGMRVGSIELRPVLVPLTSSSAVDADFVFATEHLDAKAVADAIAARGSLPCVTTDLALVREGACLMGVRSRPKVEIVVNRAAAEASGVKFATVFRVMITEI